MQAFARGVVYANTIIRGSCGVYETLHLLATLLIDLLIDGAIERNFCSPQSAPSSFKIKDGNWRQAKILTARSPEHIELHHSDHTVPISRHIVKLFQMASINILYDKLVEVHCLESYFFILLTLYLSHVGLNGIELSEADDTTTYLISSPGVKFGLSDCCLILSTWIPYINRRPSETSFIGHTNNNRTRLKDLWIAPKQTDSSDMSMIQTTKPIMACPSFWCYFFPDENKFTW